MRFFGCLLTLFALLPQYKPESPSSLVDFGFKSFKPKLDLKNFHPKIPKHIKLHIAAAFPEKDFQAYSKVFNRTLSSISSSFLIVDAQQRYYNVTVQPIFFVLPASGRFSSSIYEVMCSSFENKRVAAILVVGETPAAFTVAMAATTSNVPVVWARGEAPLPVGSLQHEDSLEVRVEPAESHLMEAVRAVLVATHWHTFTVIARPNLASRSAAALHLDPLHPKVVPITQNSHAIFRKLADVSRATRGVVLLLCDVTEAMRVMDVAKRLNMLDGHFVWLWIDTTAKPATFLSSPPHNHTLHLQAKPRRQTPFTARNRRNVTNPGKKLGSSMRGGGKEAVSRDYQADFTEGEDNAEESDDEEDEEPPPQSKTWGKITQLFPPRNPGKDDKDAPPNDIHLPLGMLAIKPEPVVIDRHLVKGSVRLLVSALHTVLKANADWISALDSDTSCWQRPTPNNKNFSVQYAMELRRVVRDTLSGDVQFQEGDRADRSLLGSFKILNLVPEKFNINFQSDASVLGDAVLSWRQVGRVTGRIASLDTIVWPGGDLVASALSARTRSVFRIVTALAPPFVMEGALDEDGQCLRGVICHRVLSSDKDNLTLVFNEMDMQERQEEEEEELGGDEKTERPLPNSPYHEYNKHKYKSSCCYGLAMDLLENVAQELQFEFHLYISPDGFYGATTHVWDENHGTPRQKWNGLVGDLVSGAAHMSFASLSVSKARSRVIDFSTPFFFGGVSMLAAPAQRSEVPLLAFLLPFSPELWIAIFTSLNITAMAVAVYEWLSPFGLNPWGRQRSRNFSIASALWVCWGLLCGHLVAFKAPKSWPNKFLINVWGGFSVIFVASYTANIAALIAGLFFHNSSDYYDSSLLTQRVGAPKSSAAEYYINLANPHLSEHMRKYTFRDVETGIALLKNGSLDILIADTPILDYYRMTDHGCKLKKIFDSLNDDTYAIGMNKGFPLKESISAVISKYNNNGYVDILKEKWYGGLPCYKMAAPIDIDMAQPRPLGVAAVAGVFLLLGLGMFVGVLILILEHLFYRYTLPILRHQPKGTIWRSRNIMFFSQKLYRFINCVELVSPHHAARELVHTLRQGQITSLFQKSVRRKEHEQRRRRKSKAQFFEMIQEIRRAQKEERDDKQLAIQQSAETGGSPRSPLKSFLTSPRSLKQAFTKSGDDDLHQRRTARSASRLDIRRFSKELFSLPRSPRSPNDKSMTSLDSEGRFSARESSAAIGRRLSKDTASWLTSSPPDMNTRRRSHLDITHTKSLNTEDTTSPNAQTKYLTLSHVNLPVISNAATLRLAGSDVKVRPRLPSPPGSPVVPIRNLNTPKINISDASMYDSIVPDKPKSHSRSKSLDNKPLNLTLVEIPTTPSTTSTTNTVTTTAKNNEKQTVNYATLEHKVALKTIKNNTKPNENGNEKCAYSEMTQSQKQVLLKQTKNEDKPHLPPKNNALKQIQARAYSAPESFRSQPPTVIFIPDEATENRRKGSETFPKERRHQGGHQSRYDSTRYGSVGRSSSVPEQRYIISASDRGSRPDGSEHKRHREGPVVTLQHSSQSGETITRTITNKDAILRNASKQSQSNRNSSNNYPTSRSISQHDTPKKSSSHHPVVRSSGAGPTPTRSTATPSQSTPQRTTQYYSSQSFDTLPRTPYNAFSFETPVTHGRPSTAIDAPRSNQHSTPKLSHHSSIQDAPRSVHKSTPTKVSQIQQEIPRPVHKSTPTKVSQSQQDATKKGFAHHADVIRASDPVRALHASFDSSKPPCGPSCHAVGAPVRSSSQQSSNLKSPKRSPGILQLPSKSMDTPPRSSSLHQHALPAVTSARTAGLQHAMSAEGTPTRNPGILKNKRRSRSRDFEAEGTAAPPSPRDNTDAQSREILLTIRRQTQGYMKPP